VIALYILEGVVIVAGFALVIIPGKASWNRALVGVVTMSVGAAAMVLTKALS
jgi:hypothetical protein